MKMKWKQEIIEPALYKLYVTDRAVYLWLIFSMYFRQEMSEEKACKEALRKKSCVPYFHPENFQIYQVQYVLLLYNTFIYTCLTALYLNLHLIVQK